MQSRTPARWGVVACLVASLGVSQVAAAGSEPAPETIRIEFDFLASELDLLGSAIVVPPDGTVDVATASIDFTGDGKGGIVPGPVSLHAFAVQITVDAVVLQNDVAGPIDADQVVPTLGTLSALDVIAFTGTLTADVDIDLQCSGPFCSEIGDFPITLSDEVVFSDLGELTLTDLAEGPAQASGTFDVDVGGLQGVLRLSGSEVSRKVVPEPATGGWVVAGLLLLWRGRRRDVPQRARPAGRRRLASGCGLFLVGGLVCVVALRASTAWAQANDYPAELGDLRMNQIQIVGTHNSYHEQPSLALDTVMVAILNQVPEAREDLCPEDPDADACIQRFRYTHASLTTQLEDYGVRQFELDVFADPKGGVYEAPLGWLATNDNPPPPFDPALVGPGFKVLHVQDLDFRSTCLTLIACLTEIRDWSLANPDHLPILILIEAKDDVLPSFDALPPFAVPPAFDPALFDALDAEIRSVFDADHLLVPDDVRGERATLREAVLMDGWPTLDEARGLVWFALDNGGGKRADYLMGHPSLSGRVLFTDSPTDSDEAAFVKRNDAFSSDIASLVEQGFMVRTRADAETQEALANDTTRRDVAFASGAHFISSDYPVPDLDLSPYVVEFENELLFRCNPVNTEAPCAFVPEPSLAGLQGAALLGLGALTLRRRRCAS